MLSGVLVPARKIEKRTVIGLPIRMLKSIFGPKIDRFAPGVTGSPAIGADGSRNRSCPRTYRFVTGLVFASSDCRKVTTWSRLVCVFSTSGRVLRTVRWAGLLTTHTSVSHEPLW